jgi:hypothetical protein
MRGVTVPTAQAGPGLPPWTAVPATRLPERPTTGAGALSPEPVFRNNLARTSETPELRCSEPCLGCGTVVYGDTFSCPGASSAGSSMLGELLVLRPRPRFSPLCLASRLNCESPGSRSSS